MNRRRFTKALGAGAVVSTAGCTTQSNGSGDGNSGSGDGTGGSDQSSVEFTIGTVGNADRQGIDSLLPYGVFEFADRVSKKDSTLKPNVVPNGQLCAETSCAEKTDDSVVQVGGASAANAADVWPPLHILTVPYLFPTLSSQAYTLTHADTWENFWVPFAKEFGIVPLVYSSMFQRQLFVGVDRAGQQEAPFSTPSEYEGLKIRRTNSQPIFKALKEWGTNPVNVAFTDIVQGLQSGVIDGMENWAAGVTAYKMSNAVGEVTVINNEDARGSTGFAASFEGNWAKVSWLKSLSEDHRSVIAEASREASQEAMQISEEVFYDRNGVTEPPGDGTAFAETDVYINELSEEERAKWKDPVRPDENPELYSSTFDKVRQSLGIDGTFDYLWEKARSSSVPSSTSEFEIDAWWDDYIDQI